jgi:hypothetical protein
VIVEIPFYSFLQFHIGFQTFTPFL